VSIVVYDRDPKSWREGSRKRRKQPDVPAIVEGESKRQVSAIVEPKRKPNSMLAHLLEEITDEERH
jgi:hypothetical protein